MVGSLSAGLLLADEAGAHLPSVDDFLPPEILFQGTPFAINRIILIRIVATIVLLVVLGVTAKRAKLIPGRWQGVVEYGLDFVRDKVVYDVMGEARGKRYVPMITTLFFTIFIFNLCGIIPGMNMAANATVVMPLVFAVWTLIQYWIAAIRSQGLGHYLRHELFTPGVPWPVYFLLAPINLLEPGGCAVVRRWFRHDLLRGVRRLPASLRLRDSFHRVHQPELPGRVTGD